MRKLNDINSPEEVSKSKIYYTPSINESGRIYHTFTSIPRFIRYSLRANISDCVWEVDMTSAQPSILFLGWLKVTADSIDVNIKNEFNLCRNLVL
jgi:hypothetical protein